MRLPEKSTSNLPTLLPSQPPHNLDGRVRTPARTTTTTMDALASVRELPPALVSRLRAGVGVGSLPQAVAEVLANALDAGSAHVAFRLDAAGASFACEDDGIGILPEAFATLAGRHCTSKVRTLADLQAGVRTLGFRGEALHGLGQVAELHVRSRARGSYETHAKTVRGGAVLRMGLAPEQLCRTGTIVEVKGLLYNQPVRRRQQQHADTR